MRKLKKIKKHRIVAITILTFLIGATAFVVSAVPDEIILFKNEKLDLGRLFTVESPTDHGGILKDNELKNADTDYFAEVKFAGVIPVKTVRVSVVENQKVIPGGNSIGIKLYTDGLMVVGLSDVSYTDGTHPSPARNSGIKTGDLIKSINGQAIDTPQGFTEIVNQSGGEKVHLEVERSGQKIGVDLKPVTDERGGYKLGMWIRNSVAGIGTMTFFNPSNNTYGALGHGITDSDTNNVVPVGDGAVVPAKIISVKRSEKGAPGELHGSFSDTGEIGDVLKNTVCGIYGHVSDRSFFTSEALEVAPRSEITTGTAYVLTSINGNDVEKYEISIRKLSNRKNAETKCMVIEITDPYLLEQTGGILQGMSGSPIIQNGKIIGAVTHVFVNDPTRGYGIFIENMLAEAEKIK